LHVQLNLAFVIAYSTLFLMTRCSSAVAWGYPLGAVPVDWLHLSGCPQKSSGTWHEILDRLWREKLKVLCDHCWIMWLAIYILLLLSSSSSSLSSSLLCRVFILIFLRQLFP